MTEENKIEISEEILLKLLQSVVHKKDCEIIAYYGQYNSCTCGIASILCGARKLLPKRQFNNRDTFGGTSAPQWLLELVERKHKPYQPRSYKPGPMSDG